MNKFYVVNCVSSEEALKVLETAVRNNFITSYKVLYEEWVTYDTNTCYSFCTDTRHPYNGCICSKDWYINKGYDIITADEFLNGFKEGEEEEVITEVKINIPYGYEIDKEHSTFECIRFKKK